MPHCLQVASPSLGLRPALQVPLSRIAALNKPELPAALTGLAGSAALGMMMPGAGLKCSITVSQLCEHGQAAVLCCAVLPAHNRWPCIACGTLVHKVCPSPLSRRLLPCLQLNAERLLQPRHG